MRIAYRNLIDELEVSDITVNSVISDYPILNLFDERLSTKLRSSAVSALTITIDARDFVDEQINTFAILGHNLTSSASIILDMNIADSWPGFTSQTIIWNEDTILKYFPTIDTDADILLCETGDTLITESGDTIVSEYGYCYFQIRINDASNPDGYIEIGRIWLGTYLQVDPSSLLDFTVTYKNDDVVVFGKGRQKFATKGVTWREFNFSFPESSHTMVSAIKTMYETVGNHSSVIFCNFDDLTDYALVLPCYCSIDGELAFQHSERMRFRYSLRFVENK